MGAHPGGAGSGVNRKDALARIEEVGRIAGDFKGGKCAAGNMLGYGAENTLRGVVENADSPGGVGIIRPQLPQHLDHHIVGGFIEEGNHDLLVVEKEDPVFFLRSGIGHLPHKVPRQGLRQGVAQLFHKGLVNKACRRGAHIGHGVDRAADRALREELRDDLLPGRAVELQLASREAVSGVIRQRIQGHDDVVAGHIGRNVVRIGDADVGRRIGGDVRDDIVVYFAVVRVKAHVDIDIRIERLEIRDRLLVDLGLRLVGVVLGPESELDLLALVQLLRHRERRSSL